MQQIILRNLIFLRPCLPDSADSRYMKHWLWFQMCVFVEMVKLFEYILKLFRIIVITWIRHSLYRTISVWHICILSIKLLNLFLVN
jgi:hypothetical protein